MNRNRRRSVAVPGQAFGEWTVIGGGPSGCMGAARWRCRCSCGVERLVYANSLRRGGTTSCGCKRRDLLSAAATRHGHARHMVRRAPEYHVWVGMRQRAVFGTASRRNYADRGIGCCARWASYEAFLADMGPRPSARHTLERVDNDKGYGPDNCVWATTRAQSRNRRNNRPVTFRGETLIVTDWAVRVGIGAMTIIGRLNRGWTVERALTEPVHAHHRRAA